MALNHKEDAYIEAVSKQTEEKLESLDAHETEENVIDLKSFTFTPRFLTNSKVILTGKPPEINDNVPNEIEEAPSKTTSSVKSRTMPKFIKKQTRRLKYRRKIPLSDELKNSDSSIDLTQTASISISSKNASIDAITSFISEEVYKQIAGLKLSEKFAKKSDFLYPRKSFTCKVALQTESENEMKVADLQKANKKVRPSSSRLRLNTSYLDKILRHNSGLDSSVSILDSKISDLCEILRNIQDLKEKELKIKEQELQIKEKLANEVAPPPTDPIVANKIQTVATSTRRKPQLPNILLSASPSKQAFYKWRQRKANLLCYKKSDRTFELNSRLINQFLMKVIPLPARNEYCGISKKCQKAYFIVN